LRTPTNDPSDDDGEIFTEINIVPFVDIVLVLLVIFMVTAPMMSKQTLDLNLPKAKSSDVRDEEILGIVILKSEQALLNGQAIDPVAAEAQFRLKSESNPNIQAVLSADLSVPHGVVVEWIDRIRQAGVKRFALEVERKK
jgi:biopolymer transport protein ExbD